MPATISSQRQRQLLALLLIAFSGLSVVTLATFEPPLPFAAPWSAANGCGPVGAALAYGQVWTFGRVASYGVPLLALAWGWNRLRDRAPGPLGLRTAIGGLLVFRFVDEDVARELLRRPEALRLGGEKLQLAILFSDLRGFTPAGERLSPEDTIALVNRHFTRMIEVVRQHQGIIVDFLGDALLAFFDPLDGPLPPKALQAVKCALAMQAAQAADIAQPTRLPVLEMGVGVHAGEVVVGNIGSESRAKYGIMGAAVNFAHRVQGQARGGEVVISAGPSMT